MLPSIWPTWAIYLVSMPLTMAFVYLGWRYLHSRKNSYGRFKELPFLGAVWHWNSLSDLPHALKPVCPSCQSLLVYEELGGRFGNQPQSVVLHCEKCESILTEQPGTWKSLQARTAREINRLIHTGEWRQHVPTHRSRWRIRRSGQPTSMPAPAASVPSGSNHSPSATQASDS
ncbi:hypothetical protein [Rhodoferax sp.]|uniref:hypothetical protein n=1 Tax=Rhodoferax sp. TaxID=50421 RepID=UPI002847B187|nr:hypothetical protein [Rhodoferax sp.]MDR3372006.1 hypothetical protein [Rhodoferax sp.]